MRSPAPPPPRPWLARARARRRGLGVWPWAVGLAMGLVVGLSATPARAQDDPTAAGLARGGALVAAPDASAAFLWNPALVPPKLRGLQVTGDLRVDARRVTSRLWGQDVDRTSRAPLEPRPLPGLAVQGSLGVLHLTAGVWVRRQSDERAWFPGQNPEPDPLVPSAYDKHRYGALRYQLTTDTYGLSLAWHPRPWIALGVALAGNSLRISHERILWTGPPADADPELGSTADDLEVHVSLRARFVPEGRFGLYLRPVRFLRLGASFALPGRARFTGRATLPQEPGGRVVTLVPAANADVRLRLPFTLRGALGVDVGRVSLDAQLAFQGAPDPREARVNTTGLLIRRTTSTSLIPIVSVPLGWQSRSRWELGVGAVVRAFSWLDLVVGYRFTESPLAAGHHTAARVDPDRHLLSAGLTVRHGRFRLDLAYARAWAVMHHGPGEARLTNPAYPQATVRIGDERQSRNGDLVSISLGVALDYLP